MDSSTAHTIWPAIAVSDEVKFLIERFFSLVDDPSNNSGDRLADEVFTPDGTMVAAAGTATGSAEIRGSRKNAWVVIKKRSHSIQRVYIHDTECSDLMLIGNVEMTLAHGQSVIMDFTARMVVSRDSPARLKSYQVWADPTPLTKLLSGK